jgi:hypothetical protein
MPPNTSTRPWYQYSIRTLLLVVVVWSVLCSWLAVWGRRAQRQREAVQAIEESGGIVRKDWAIDTLGEPVAVPAPRRGEWFTSLFPDGYFSTVTIASINDESQLEHLSSLPDLVRIDVTCSLDEAHVRGLCGSSRLRELNLFGARLPNSQLRDFAQLQELRGLRLRSTNIADGGLVPIAGLKKLERLDLATTPITDAGLKHLACLTTLTELDLSNTDITDAGVEDISRLMHIERLLIGGTRVTDAGVQHLTVLTQLRYLSLELDEITDTSVEHLSKLHQLEWLIIGRTSISDHGVSMLRTALPKCTIER